MYNELKPCPFCGGEAELYQSYCGYYQIECHQCSARSCTAVEKESVISNWNMRSTTERKSKTMTLDEAIEHFKGGCANSCPHERKERAVREWITESIDDAKQQIEEMLIEHWKDEIGYLEDRLKEFQEKQTEE